MFVMQNVSIKGKWCYLLPFS